MRDMATDLVADGARVKVCVQQALGQGVFQACFSIMHLLCGTGQQCPATSLAARPFLSSSAGAQHALDLRDALFLLCSGMLLDCPIYFTWNMVFARSCRGEAGSAMGWQSCR